MCSLFIVVKVCYLVIGLKSTLCGWVKSYRHHNIQLVILFYFLGTTRVVAELEDRHHHVVLVKVRKTKTAFYREVKEDHRKVNPVVTDLDVGAAAAADSVEALCEGVTWVPLEVCVSILVLVCFPNFFILISFFCSKR